MNEHDEDVRGWLHSVEGPSPRLDLAEVVQIGRAQVRRRRQLAAGASGAVALAVAAAVPVAIRMWPGDGDPYVAADQYPALDCTITELPLPSEHAEREGITISPVDVGSSGRYIVGYPMGSVTEVVEGRDGSASTIHTYSAEGLEPVLWDNGVPTAIPALRGSAHASGVNSSGVVVGAGVDDGDDWYGWVYRDGEVTELPAPAGYRVFSIWDINDAGDIMGEVAAADAPDNSDSRPVVWPAGNLDQPRLLSVPAGMRIEPSVAITDDGTVVGNLSVQPPDEPAGSIGQVRAYAWDPNGVGHYLPLPPGASEAWVWGGHGRWAVGHADVSVPAESVWRSAEATGSAEAASQSPGVPPSDLPADQPTGGSVTVDTPVRWNLVTGEAQLLDPYQGRDRTHAYAYDVSDGGDVMLGSGMADVYRDGQWFVVPHPTGGTVLLTAMDSTGTVFVGEVIRDPVVDGELFKQPAVWHC